jgi:hypothetical protein
MFLFAAPAPSHGALPPVPHSGIIGGQLILSPRHLKLVSGTGRKHANPDLGPPAHVWVSAPAPSDVSRVRGLGWQGGRRRRS